MYGFAKITVLHWITHSQVGPRQHLATPMMIHEFSSTDSAVRRDEKPTIRTSKTMKTITLYKTRSAETTSLTTDIECGYNTACNLYLIIIKTKTGFSFSLL